MQGTFGLKLRGVNPGATTLGWPIKFLSLTLLTSLFTTFYLMRKHRNVFCVQWNTSSPKNELLLRPHALALSLSQIPNLATLN